VDVTPEQPLLVLTLGLQPQRDDVAEYGRGVTPPVRLSGQLPRLPAECREAGLAGRVEAEALVDTQGCVAELRLLRSGGAPLDAAFVEAVRAWRFTPARQGGRRVAVWLRLRHDFGV
jgi:TonB family protein